MQSVTLLTRNAISANLLNLMAELSWRAVPGDFIFITYAGHGSQIPDVNGDEPDGRDETWCLYDRMIVDDEIYAALSQFRAGVRIFFVSDSCHSGSVVRVMMQAGLDRAIPLIADFYGGNPIVSRAAPEPLARTIYERNANYFNAIQWNSGVENASNERQRTGLIRMPGQPSRRGWGFPRAIYREIPADLGEWCLQRLIPGASEAHHWTDATYSDSELVYRRDSAVRI